MGTMALNSGTGCASTPGALWCGHARVAAYVAHVAPVQVGVWLTTGGQAVIEHNEIVACQL